MSIQLGSAEPLVIAHRGDSIAFAENSMAAIRSAIEKGADLIEFDVRATTDASLFLFHDKDLKRYGGGETLFDDLDRESALKIDVGAGETPPDFAVAVQECLQAGVIPLIERKSGTAEAYLDILDQLDAREKVVVQSFDWEFLADLKKLAPEISLGALGSDSLSNSRLAELEKLAPDWVGWNQRDLTESGVSALHDRGFKVAVWTLNDLARIQKFAAAGVDAIITDRPGEVKGAFQSTKK